MNAYWTMNTNLLGNITIQCDDQYLVSVRWGCICAKGQQRKTQLLSDACIQLQEYLCGKRKRFSLPLNVQGTTFEKQVYQALLTIPYGETASYEDIAKAVGHPRAYRAVGTANKKNLLPILVPCHRVINKNGNLGGFAPGLSYKKKLLELERKHAVY